jgi:hypothetical protein
MSNASRPADLLPGIQIVTDPGGRADLVYHQPAVRWFRSFGAARRAWIESTLRAWADTWPDDIWGEDVTGLQRPLEIVLRSWNTAHAQEAHAHQSIQTHSTWYLVDRTGELRELALDYAVPLATGGLSLPEPVQMISISTNGSEQDSLLTAFNGA